MPIISGGYFGPITDRQWALSAPFHGFGRHAVRNEQAWSVVPNPNVARGVIVRAGVGWGDGVIDDNNTDVALASMAAPGSGEAPYAIVARRDWAARKTTFEAVPNAVNPVLSEPGVRADQLVAVAIVSAGDTAITTIYDRRTWVEGARTFVGRRTGSQALAGDVASFLVGVGGPRRRGEYLLTVAATVDNRSAVLARASININNVEVRADDQNLLANQPTQMSLTTTYLHEGGEMAAGFFLRAYTANWSGGTLRPDATFTAVWVGPMP